MRCGNRYNSVALETITQIRNTPPISLACIKCTKTNSDFQVRNKLESMSMKKKHTYYRRIVAVVSWFDIGEGLKWEASSSQSLHVSSHVHFRILPRIRTIQSLICLATNLLFRFSSSSVLHFPKENRNLGTEESLGNI